MAHPTRPTFVPLHRRLGACSAGLAITLTLSLALSAGAQPEMKPAAPADAAEVQVEPRPLPPAPDAIDKLLNAPHLTPDQLKDKRVYFGRYTAADLDSPARAAKAALIRGAYDDPSFTADGVDPLDAAEAMIRRGELAAALKAITTNTPRAARLRAEAFEQLARFQEAVAVADPVIAALNRAELSSADDIAEAVRLQALRTRIAGPGGPGREGARGGAASLDYNAMMQRLSEARTRGDRFAWPVMLAEAQLLYAKDNKQQAAQALEQILSLNPTCADAWALLGRMTVDSFAFDNTEQVAKRLDILAGDWSGEDPDPLPSGRPGTVSPYAAAIIARSQLRQSEGAQALAVIEPLLAKYPQMPELLALRCAAEAVRFDFAASDSCLAKFDQTFGPSPYAHFETGKALSDARQYDKSRVALQEAARRQPMAPEPHAELGLMLLQAGDDVGALAALEKSFALDPFNIRADNSLRMARELQTYDKVESQHFIIRYKPGPGTNNGPSDAILAHEMVGPLEASHAAVCRTPTLENPFGVDHVPAKKTIIELMPNHEWFGVRIAGMPAIHTIAASTGPVIAMESPRDGPKHLGTYDWVRVLRHEYVHTVTLSRTNNRIPHWFTEAAAVYLEMAPRDYQTCQLLTMAYLQGDLFDFEEINLAFVRPKKPRDRSQAYAQGHWMYQYIVQRFGPRAPLDLMDKYAAGIREEESFQSVLSVSRAQFFDDFKVWAKQQLVDWGMLPPTGQPSIRQLLARESLKKPDLEAAVRESLQRIADDKENEGDHETELAESKPEVVTAWLNDYPTHPDVLELAVEDALKPSSGLATPETAPLIERYAAARPVDPKPHRLLAKMYLDAAAKNPAQLTAQAEKAIPHLEFLDQREQKVPTFAIELARRYASLGQLDKASAKAERATQLAPFTPRPRELAATIALQLKDLAAAERHIAALAQIEPNQEIHKQRLDAIKKMRAQ